MKLRKIEPLKPKQKKAKSMCLCKGINGQLKARRVL